MKLLGINTPLIILKNHHSITSNQSEEPVKEKEYNIIQKNYLNKNLHDNNDIISKIKDNIIYIKNIIKTKNINYDCEGDIV